MPEAFFRLSWDPPDERYYHHGVDRGTIWFPESDIRSGDGPIAWNGITGVEEGTEPGAAVTLYHDGVIYHNGAEASDFKGSLTAMSWPDALSANLGMPMIADGLFVDNQVPMPFGFSYRTLVGSGQEGDMYGYQIHLLYNVVAVLNSRSRKTLNETIQTTEFSFDLLCTPMPIPGCRPAAHLIIDTRYLSQAKVDEIQGRLYGDDGYDGYLLEPALLLELMDIGDRIIVQKNAADGTFNIEAASSNIEKMADGTFRVYGVNATAPDANGTYTISTGGNTTVNDG